jgi:hypothetical protein
MAGWQQPTDNCHDEQHEGFAMATPTQVSDEQIHAMCAYVRGEKCSQCSASVDTPYGAGQPGCHAIAEETLEKAREILAHPRAGLTNWIPVSERLPYEQDCEPHTHSVMCWHERLEARMIDHWSNVHTNKNYTLWQPMPPLPTNALRALARGEE